MIDKIIILLIFIATSYAITLQEVFDNAPSYGEYEKYIILEPNTVYTGGVGIYEGDIYINCQGSIIDLEGGNGIWVYADVEYPSSLDIEYCTITNGLYYGLSFGGLSTGNVINCNLINTNFGLKLFDVSDVFTTNSIFINNNSMGIGVYSTTPSLDANYLLFWNNEDDCLENCPGWGSIWTPLELSPGTGVIYENPQFLDSENFNFELLETSPCINSGNPEETLDYDGTVSDIGANPYTNQYCTDLGDLNNDGSMDVLDVVQLVNCILFSDVCTICFDINEDEEYNVLDVLETINLIINNY